ncbi:helix-turn-helix transcriptional regulator [Saccharicrinis sp. FJH2]|uniref:helix-turn-helix transcriptional regulator n=1 Tax=Saccharicrinis sp. FJH65 TaxID=3344659 RepID=UPI0035F2D496
MKDRIAELIEKEGLTPSKFADMIEVQRSNISHILAGRNKPSLDFLQKIINTFPDISGDWLLSGSGPMYKNEAIHPVQTDKADNGVNLFNTQEHTSAPLNKPLRENRIAMEKDASKRIKKIVVIYDDFSMDEFVLDKHLE